MTTQFHRSLDTGLSPHPTWCLSSYRAILLGLVIIELRNEMLSVCAASPQARTHGWSRAPNWATLKAWCEAQLKSAASEPGDLPITGLEGDRDDALELVDSEKGPQVENQNS